MTSDPRPPNIALLGAGLTNAAMLGYVANTDHDWYRFLAARPHLEEVNFWQPSGSRRFRAIEPGAPFFFKLKRPHYAIAGFGVYLRSTILPDWLAWECFGEGNGAESFLRMKEKVQRYRQRNGIALDEAPRLGCLVVSRPVFFPPDLWVPQPSDWKRNVVSGATYSLDVAEGQRLLAECQERAAVLLERFPSPATREVEIREVLDAYGRGILVRPRLGQGTFRLAVQDAYEGACAVTNEHSLPALEAGHIKPYALEQRHEVTNGLLLRGDLHRLFDRGYVTVNADGVFRVSERLREDYQNGKTYYPHDGTRIRLPADERLRPDRERLAWHAETVFLG